MVDINKVVNVDFNIITQTSPLSTYENVVDLVLETAGSFDGTTSYTSEESATAEGAAYNTTPDDAKIFFALGGKKLTPLTATDSTAFDVVMNYKKIVANKEDDFICVCVSGVLTDSDKLKTFMDKVSITKAPNKILVLTSGKDSVEILNGMSYGNLTYKLYTADSKVKAEFSIAAYLSNINLKQANSMRDYCFTNEKAVVNTGNLGEGPLKITDVNTNYDDYKKYVNWIDSIGRDNYVNFGGNTVGKTSIVAEFGAIAAENAVTYAALNTMLQKQYLTDMGLNNIVAAINAALSNYVTNGFLETNSTYTGVTRYKGYGSNNYTLISTGDELVNGYVVRTIPMSRLTLADRQNRKFTPIYVYMQTMGGAREVEITGDILD